jgi:hypothetical protein
MWNSDYWYMLWRRSLIQQSFRISRGEDAGVKNAQLERFADTLRKHEASIKLVSMQPLRAPGQTPA